MPHAHHKPAGLRRIAPLRFLAFAIVACIGTAVAVPFTGWQHGVLVSFDLAASAFLLSLVPLFGRGESEDMRRRAAINDANRVLLLLITGAVALVVLVVIALELGAEGNPSPAIIGLLVTTLALSWLFTNTVYALHYAHIYYLGAEGGGDRGGLSFPKTPEPDYWDFVYFAYTLGMTFQTSDCEIESGHLRKVATLHSLIAFVFNIGVIAFTINVLGSSHA